MQSLKSLFRDRRELALVVGMVLILLVLFAPIPAFLLDLAIITNLGLSLTIFLLTLYVAKPVEFSTFPSLLLISTLFRLALNVAATRLILTHGDAGEVIGSIGEFAVSGNFVVGLVVFLILVVVQFIVVTSGAQRVSEVAARFTLDSMPGQQMSIDADLNMGLINQQEALRRRAALEKEASFYGAMDGASKFVKGDAIAGVIILLIDIIAGWLIGVMQMGMGWSEALQRFTLLTIGDGIATQVPALIISVATGIIVTRSSADRELSTEIFAQLSSAPRILFIVASILSLLLLLPGMPKWPIVLLLGLIYLAWRQSRRQAQIDADVASTTSEHDASSQQTSFPVLSIGLGGGLAEAWRTKQAIIMDRIASLRQAQEESLGVAFPPLKIVDASQLGAREYEIRLFGTRYAGGEIDAERTLAIAGDGPRPRLQGVECVDPAYGLPAVWIDAAEEARAREAGYTLIDPITVFITHLKETLREEAPALLTRSAVVQMLEDVRKRQNGLIEEIVPNQLSVSDVQRVLQSLLSEGVPIAAIDLIAEHLADLSRTERDCGVLTEQLRQRLGVAICNKLKNRRRELSVMSLDPRLEHQIQTSVATSGKREALALDPGLAERVIRKLAAMANDMRSQGLEPVLLCGGDIRRQVRAMTRRAIPHLSVLSVNEIPTAVELRSFGIIRLEPGPSSPHDPAPQRTQGQRDALATEGLSFGHA